MECGPPGRTGVAAQELVGADRKQGDDGATTLPRETAESSARGTKRRRTSATKTTAVKTKTRSVDKTKKYAVIVTAAIERYVTKSRQRAPKHATNARTLCDAKEKTPAAVQKTPRAILATATATTTASVGLAWCVGRTTASEEGSAATTTAANIR